TRPAGPVGAPHRPSTCGLSSTDPVTAKRHLTSVIEPWEPAMRKLIGIRVRQFRDAKGWTQRQLSEFAGLDRTFVTETEGGHRNPSIASLLKLASALECRLIDLVPPEVEALPRSRSKRTSR